MRVNSLGLFAQYAARGSQFERWLAHAEPVERFSRFLDRFGVAVGLSLHYAEPDEDGGYGSVCPFSDELRTKWRDFAARLADVMPSVRNAIVWGAGENAPGPHEDDCERCRALPGTRARSGRYVPGQRCPGDDRRRAACGRRSRTRPRTPNRRRRCSAIGGMRYRRMCGLRPAIFTGDFRPPYPPHPIWGPHRQSTGGAVALCVSNWRLVGGYRRPELLPCSMAHRWQEEFLKGGRPRAVKDLTPTWA